MLCPAGGESSGGDYLRWCSYGTSTWMQSDCQVRQIIGTSVAFEAAVGLFQCREDFRFAGLRCGAGWLSSSPPATAPATSEAKAASRLVPLAR